MVDTGRETIIERVARWAAALRFDDLPSRIVERIGLQIGTTISSAASSPWHTAAQTVARARRSRGNALVFASGERVAPCDAPYVNSAFAMSLDYDDYLLSCHPSHSAVLVPLAHARRLGDVVVAAAAANELMGRLSTACLLGPLNGQMTTYVHNAGAALALGKVLGFPARTLAHALGIALYQPNFALVPGFWNEGSKTVTGATALDVGMQAARLAEAGLEGPADAIEHPMGFLTHFAFARFPGLFEGFGHTWFSDTLSYKRFPGTSYISAAVEATLELSGGRVLTPEEIDEVRVATTLFSASLDSLGAAAIDREPLDANAINFSVRLSVAAALRFGDLLPEHLRPESIAREAAAIRAIAGKVRVEHELRQTLRLFAGSPVSLGLFTSLGLNGVLALAGHTRRVNTSSGAAGRNPTRLRGTLAELAVLLGRLSKTRRGHVSDRDFDARAFRMYQSADVALRSRGALRRAAVAIPMGACGRDHEEAGRLVRSRLEHAFGERGGAIYERLFDRDTEVEALYALAAPRRPPIPRKTRGIRRGTLPADG